LCCACENGSRARRKSWPAGPTLAPGRKKRREAAIHGNDPADVFASRRPDPVLQQVEDFGDGTISANDCFRPVSRYFDRILRPEQILVALKRAISVLTDPAACGPVTLALCQDVQAEGFDCPRAFLAPHVWRIRRPPADPAEVAAAASALRAAEAPLVIVGGGDRRRGGGRAAGGAAQALAERGSRRLPP
jgi:3D-(3,5/4)-trihydroxycyclohexane-1,2-dione acylhydrolase (decyclizing)